MPNITIRTNTEISEKINQLAKAMERPRNWVIEDALKRYISEQSWQIEAIKQARKSMAEGKGIDFDKSVKQLKTRIKKEAAKE